jgi:hypothetical protein
MEQVQTWVSLEWDSLFVATLAVESPLGIHSPKKNAIRINPIVILLFFKIFIKFSIKVYNLSP